MREKPEKGKKAKRWYLERKGNILANTLPVISEKISDSTTFTAISYQREGSEPLQRTYGNILQFRITRLPIIHRDSS